jgi:hypothetical protein
MWYPGLRRIDSLPCVAAQARLPAFAPNVRRSCNGRLSVIRSLYCCKKQSRALSPAGSRRLFDAGVYVGIRKCRRH